MDEMCLEMCKITRWERGYRLILDRVDFSVHKKEKVLIRGKIQEDTRQMFQVASGVTAVQEGTYRISRAGIIPEQFPDLERMRAIDYLLLPLLTQGYNRKQAWGRIKPMVKTSTLWEKRMIYADNLTAYEKGVLLSIAALSTEPEIVLAGDGISEMTEEERKKFGTLISGWLADLGMAFVAFGNLWEGICTLTESMRYRTDIFWRSITHGREKDEANHKKSTVSAVVTFTVSHADTGSGGMRRQRAQR